MQRAKIILMAADNIQNIDIAAQLGTTRHTVARWRDRFLVDRIAGIEKDATRPGRKRKYSDAFIRKMVHATTQEKPGDATHWSTRSMARAMGVSEATVRRVWKRHGLRPHLVRTFKLSNDPHFIEKLEDIIVLYLNPPEHAIVLSVDEKSQIQALDRTQPGLPLKEVFRW
jgi:transposase-like protein